MSSINPLGLARLAPLNALHLYGMATAWSELLAEGPRRPVQPEAWLDRLIEAELADRQVRSLRYQLKAARFPVHRDLTGIDWAETPLPRTDIETLATGAFMETAQNLILVGGTGTGKTHVATALGVAAIHQRKRVRFFNAVDLVNQLEREKQLGKAGNMARPLVQADAVIVDELGYLPFPASGGALLFHLISAKSFVPPPAIRDLRELVRHRRPLIETRTAGRNRVLKLLEGANIKLSGVASDVFGGVGHGHAGGTRRRHEQRHRDGGLARGRMRRKHAALEAALDGRMREHQCFLLGMQLHSLGTIDQDLEALDARIGAQLEPYQAQHRLLMQIPGVDWVTAAIIAEIGTDMDVFTTARRLAAWAGLAPGNYESAGKPKGVGTRRGNVFLKSALFAAASAAVRTKGSYYRDKYNRLRARRGLVRAIMAIPHKLLIAAFHMLSTGEAFRDLGESYLDQVARKRSTTRLVQRLSNLGYDVMLVPKAA